MCQVIFTSVSRLCSITGALHRKLEVDFFTLHLPPTKDNSLAKECLEVELEKVGVSLTVLSLPTS